jgi:valyl-tRNA synthetase
MTEPEETKYSRWSLQEDSNIDYGYFTKTGGAGISEDSSVQSFYITTAINYTNGPAHMGHAYEATTSDALARYHRLKGEGPVFFLTGADEHGQKIANTAADLDQQPIEICDKVSNVFQTCHHACPQLTEYWCSTLQVLNALISVYLSQTMTMSGQRQNVTKKRQRNFGRDALIMVISTWISILVGTIFVRRHL